MQFNWHVRYENSWSEDVNDINSISVLFSKYIVFVGIDRKRPKYCSTSKVLRLHPGTLSFDAANTLQKMPM